MTPAEEQLMKAMDDIGKYIKDSDLNSIDDVLERMHPSMRYEVINRLSKRQDFSAIVRKERNNAMGQDVKSTKKPYQRYQDLKAEAIKMNKHDNTPAKMIDVDRAVWNAYCILLNMISTINKTVIKQSEAINKIEKAIGLEPTDFDGGDDNGTDTDNVQRDEGAGESAGEPSQ